MNEDNYNWSRRECGLLLHNWHNGQNDPIYAVGSFYFESKPHPQRWVVEGAIANLEGCLSMDEHFRSGLWTEADREELQKLVADLKQYLIDDYSDDENSGE